MSYDLYSFPNPSGMGKLLAVTAPNACTLNTAQEAMPWPRLRVLSGWMGVWGPGAEARVANVTVNASGSELVVHEVRDEHSVLVSYRFYVREASGGGKVVAVNGTVMRNVPEGMYTDLRLNSSGAVASTTEPATFDVNSPPAGSEGIIGLIDAAKQAAGVD